MKLVLDSHNVEVTDAIKEHVQTCVDKLEHMNQRALEARVHLERDHVGLPTNKFKCAINLYFKGADLFAEDYENDLYASIDLVTKKDSGATSQTPQQDHYPPPFRGVEGQGGVADGQRLMGCC